MLARQRHRGSQSGITLLETLIALVICGTLILALVNGLIVSTRSTVKTNDIGRVESGVSTWAQNLKLLDYQPCADPGWYETAYANDTDFAEDEDQRIEDGTTIEITSVQYWQPGSSRADQAWTMGSWGPDCALSGDHDTGAQRIDIRGFMGTGGERVERRFSVVKRSDVGTNYVAGETTIAPSPNITARLVATLSTGAGQAVSPAVGPAPLGVDFDASSSAGSNLTFLFDFGNGTKSPGSGQPDTAPLAHYDFPPGIYLVTVKVVDDSGQQATQSVTVFAQGAPGAVSNLRLTKTGKLNSGINVFDRYGLFEWNALPGATEYELEVVSQGGIGQCPSIFDPPFRFTGKTTATSLRVSTSCWLAFGLGSYTARVRALVAGVPGPWSANLDVNI